MADDIPLTKISSTVGNGEIHERDWNKQTFFPFQADRERHQIKLNQHAASFPVLGFGALIGALTLMALSGAILLVIQQPGKVVSDWTVHVYRTSRDITIPKPAAWLSGILSGITVCFISLYKKDSTSPGGIMPVKRLPRSRIYMKSGGMNGLVGLSRKITRNQEQPYSRRKNFSYVALATLFVATIPLNGFLLQNAVVVELATAHKNGTIKVPLVNANTFASTDMLAYATADPIGGGVHDWSPALGLLSQSIFSKVAATADLSSYNTTCLGSCKAVVPAMGFSINCTDTIEHYEIPQNTENITDASLDTMRVNGSNVFSVQATYDYQKQNTITIRSLWKNDLKCTGDYSLQTCSLALATVEYPVLTNTGVKEAADNRLLRNTTTLSLEMDLINDSPKVLEIITQIVEHPSHSYTAPFAGVAGLLAQTLNSSINLRYTDYTPYYNMVTAGLFAQQQLATTGISFTYENYLAQYISTACNGTIGNASQQAFGVAKLMMFQFAAYNWLSYYGSPYTTGAQDIPANTPKPMAVQMFQQNQYRVVWPGYFGAMAVTLVVSLFILPTFWGYWRLERRVTMSPFETARAFHAPMLYQGDATVSSDDLIERVGNVQIHRDFPVVPVSEPSSSRTATAH